MYKQKHASPWKRFKQCLHWTKRRVFLIIAAFMIGVSNVIYEEERMLNGNQNHIEQEQRDDSSRPD